MCPLKFLFLNLSSQSRWHMKAQLFLFQKRYHDPKCCGNRRSDKQKRGVTFPIIPLSSECAGLAVPRSTFWAVTQSISRAELATIPSMKEEMQGFHMTPNFEIFICEITLFWPNYTSIRVGPRTCKSVGVNDLRAPPKVPKGVLLAATTNTDLERECPTADILRVLIFDG